MRNTFYDLYDENGVCLDTCKAFSSDEAFDYFADNWEINDDMYVEESCGE